MWMQKPAVEQLGKLNIISGFKECYRNRDFFVLSASYRLTYDFVNRGENHGLWNWDYNKTGSNKS